MNQRCEDSSQIWRGKYLKRVYVASEAGILGVTLVIDIYYFITNYNLMFIVVLNCYLIPTVGQCFRNSIAG